MVESTYCFDCEMTRQIMWTEVYTFLISTWRHLRLLEGSSSVLPVMEGETFISQMSVQFITAV